MPVATPGLAGTVEAVGDGVATLRPGDRVYAINVKVPLFLVAELAPARWRGGAG